MRACRDRFARPALRTRSSGWQDSYQPHIYRFEKWRMRSRLGIARLWGRPSPAFRSVFFNDACKNCVLKAYTRSLIFYTRLREVRFLNVCDSRTFLRFRRKIRLGPGVKFKLLRNRGNISTDFRTQNMLLELKLSLTC